MKYAVNLEPNKLNCFPEKYWSEHNNFDILSQEPFNNVLFEHEFEDLTTDDLICVDGEIQVDLAKYHASRDMAKLEQLRATRDSLLKAFDIYKSNVIYGLVSETEEENAIMTKWYLGLLDMRESAILHEVPSKVAYYI